MNAARQEAYDEAFREIQIELKQLRQDKAYLEGQVIIKDAEIEELKRIEKEMN